jgi:hypothetical protein
MNLMENLFPKGKGGQFFSFTSKTQSGFTSEAKKQGWLKLYFIHCRIAGKKSVTEKVAEKVTGFESVRESYYERLGGILLKHKENSKYYLDIRLDSNNIKVESFLMSPDGLKFPVPKDRESNLQIGEKLNKSIGETIPLYLYVDSYWNESTTDNAVAYREAGIKPLTPALDNILEIKVGGKTYRPDSLEMNTLLEVFKSVNA